MSKIKRQLLTELSKANTLLVADYIGHDMDKLEELWQIILKEPSPLPERASWALNKYIEMYPVYQEKIYAFIMGSFDKIKLHPVIRNAFRILAMQEKYEPDHIPILLDTAFDHMMSSDKPVAIKVYCMQVLYHIAQVETDIKQELIFAIEEEMPKNSVGFKSRGSRIIKKLKRELREATS